MTKSIGWGILGLGKIANKFTTDLRLVEGAHVAGVASRNIDKAKTFAETHKAKSFYGDYQSLFEDPEVDIIYIATPHSSHMDYSIKAMNAGKHVLCEKPLAVNKIQQKKMIEASIANQVFLMEAFWTRFHPSINQILDQIKNDAIGAVNYLNADFCFYKEAPPESRMYNMELAGGSLLDVGVYPIFLAYMIFGYPKEILATGRFHETGADLQTAIILKHETGISNLASGFASKSDMVAKIHGTKGRITIDEPWHHSHGYNLKIDSEIEHVSLPLNGLGFTYEIEECHKCIQQGLIESKVWSHQNSLDLISICDEVRNQIGLQYPFE